MIALEHIFYIQTGGTGYVSLRLRWLTYEAGPRTPPPPDC